MSVWCDSARDATNPREKRFHIEQTPYYVAAREFETLPQLNPDSSDEALMQAYRQGNPEGFDMLLVRYQKAIFAFIYRFTQNAAHSEELLQEVFMKVIAAAPTYQAKASFKTWLYTIARRSCIDHARKAKHRRTQAFVETVHEDPQASPDTGLRQKNLQQGIADALAKLSTEQREVFLLREYSGLSFKEIATTIGCSEGTVKSRMRYALLSLRQSLLNFRQSSYPPKELA